MNIEQSWTQHWKVLMNSLRTHWLRKPHYLGIRTHLSSFNSIHFIDHLYSPPLSKVHYGRDLYSSRKI